MFGMLIRRLLGVVPVALLLSFVLFTMLELAPGDVSATVAGGEEATAENIARARAELRLDDPFLVRYVRWLGDAVHGDLGVSEVTKEPVTTLLARGFPVTASLGVVAMVLALVVSLPLGFLAGVRPGGWLDRGIVVLTSIGLATPSFWIGLVLIVVFAVNLSLLPAIGYEPLADGFWPWLRHLLLPGLALATHPIAELTRQVRVAVRESLGKDFVLTAYAKGLPPASLLVKHAAKSAAIPVVTVFGVQLVRIIGFAVVIERVFAMKGLGNLALSSVLSQDVNPVLGVLLLVGVWVMVVNVFVDVSYAYLNPKVRQR